MDGDQQQGWFPHTQQPHSATQHAAGLPQVQPLVQPHVTAGHTSNTGTGMPGQQTAERGTHRMMVPNVGVADSSSAQLRGLAVVHTNPRGHSRTTAMAQQSVAGQFAASARGADPAMGNPPSRSEAGLQHYRYTSSSRQGAAGYTAPSTAVATRQQQDTATINPAAAAAATVGRLAATGTGADAVLQAHAATGRPPGDDAFAIPLGSYVLPSWARGPPVASVTHAAASAAAAAAVGQHPQSQYHSLATLQGAVGEGQVHQLQQYQQHQQHLTRQQQGQHVQPQTQQRQTWQQQQQPSGELWYLPMQQQRSVGVEQQRQSQFWQQQLRHPLSPPPQQQQQQQQQQQLSQSMPPLRDTPVMLQSLPAVLQSLVTSNPTSSNPALQQQQQLAALQQRLLQVVSDSSPQRPYQQHHATRSAATYRAQDVQHSRLHSASQAVLQPAANRMMHAEAALPLQLLLPVGVHGFGKAAPARNADAVTAVSTDMHKHQQQPAEQQQQQQHGAALHQREQHPDLLLPGSADGQPQDAASARQTAGASFAAAVATSAVGAAAAAAAADGAASGVDVWGLPTATKMLAPGSQQPESWLFGRATKRPRLLPADQQTEQHILQQQQQASAHVQHEHVKQPQSPDSDDVAGRGTPAAASALLELACSGCPAFDNAQVAAAAAAGAQGAQEAAPEAAARNALVSAKGAGQAPQGQAAAAAAAAHGATSEPALQAAAAEQDHDNIALQEQTAVAAAHATATASAAPGAAAAPVAAAVDGMPSSNDVVIAVMSQVVRFMRAVLRSVDLAQIHAVVAELGPDLLEAMGKLR